MDTLYITDLDGTLLNSRAELTDKSGNILTKLIERNMNLIVATARNRDNALPLLKRLNLKLPIICDGGAFIYDPVKKHFLAENYLPAKKLYDFAEKAREKNVLPVVFTMDGGKITVYHSDKNNDGLRGYFKEMDGYSMSTYIKDTSYRKYKDKNVFNISAIDTYDNLLGLNEAAQKIPGVRVEFFSVHYNKRFWWLQIVPEKSGKGYAVDKLKKVYKPRRIVCFGDNLNDLCMFERADLAVATQNAVDELKDKADIIIGSCDEDSVAKFIEKDFKESIK